MKINRFAPVCLRGGEPIGKAEFEIVENLTNMQILQIVATIVTKYGCEIIEMDLENRILDIDGPPEARMKCAVELQNFLEE